MSSIFDSVSKLAGGLLGGESGGTDSATTDHPAVTGGLLQQLGGTGGLGNLIQTIQQNGGGSIVQDIASGNTSAIDPNQVENLLAGSGLVDGVASKTGLSPDQVKSSLATVLPMLLHHSIANGHVTADGQPGDTPAPDAGSLLQSVLGKLL
ncbi:YidB family protein [Terracidiphilus sp.]|jgi:uncharacterized protein YidB (DUF937 family)|uniref:YidB family protein n=1 Tax=Terracidiphilus sp. TaxID=1964191 RepID=UPI003C136352